MCCEAASRHVHDAVANGETLYIAAELADDAAAFKTNLLGTVIEHTKGDENILQIC